MESGPVRCSTLVYWKPASRIQAKQSFAVKSKPPGVSTSMFRLISSPKALLRRSSFWSSPACSACSFRGFSTRR